jgi:hypothetical protein
MIFKPAEVGWRLGRAYEPRGGGLWVPWDRTTGVIGPPGSGKTLDLLAPALRPATDLADLIRRGGTVYLLGREDPYAPRRR